MSTGTPRWVFPEVPERVSEQGGRNRTWVALVTGQHSLKVAYSTGSTTRRGTDFDTLNVTWQLVIF